MIFEFDIRVVPVDEGENKNMVKMLEIEIRSHHTRLNAVLQREVETIVDKIRVGAKKECDLSGLRFYDPNPTA